MHYKHFVSSLWNCRRGDSWSYKFGEHQCTDALKATGL